MDRRASTVPVSRQAHPRCDAERTSSSAGPATRLHTHLVLGSLPSAVPCARAHCRAVLREWGLAHLSDTTELVLSELVTNSVRASATLDGHWWQGTYHHGRPPIRLWVSSDGKCAVVSCWDGSEEEPSQPSQPAAPGQEHGRGLYLVAMLAEETGVSRLEECSGKLVWAVIGGCQA